MCGFNRVRLVVYDVLGQSVIELVNGHQRAGEHRVPFDASVLTSGVYFYRLEAGSGSGLSSGLATPPS